jgi:hypothetical protein
MANVIFYNLQVLTLNPEDLRQISNRLDKPSTEPGITFDETEPLDDYGKIRFSESTKWGGQVLRDVTDVSREFPNAVFLLEYFEQMKGVECVMINDADTFATSSLPFASYLTAGRHLEFRGVELTDSTSAIFLFYDPQRRGRELARAFAEGATVSAIDFHAQRRRLRGELNLKLSAARSSAIEQIRVKENNSVRSLAGQW